MVVHGQIDDDVLHLLRCKQRLILLRQARFHPQGQAHPVGIARVAREVRQRHFCRSLLAGGTLCAEGTAFLQELVDVQVARLQIILPRKRNEGIRHQQILVALLDDFRLRCIQIQPPKHCVGILAGAGMRCAVRDVLRRVVDEVERLRADLRVGTAEPVDVKRAALQLVGG